jgi:hypothetical protein
VPCEESRWNAGPPTEKELLARLKELVDTRPTEGHCPIEWAVPAYFLGDMGAVAMLSLRRRP